jgi:alkanesulfonate monooxygenase SsuD/methylene tetrahydromethanopterin reductase-like flavin-dependent oxidoreductase (luciferase family)
MAISFGIFDHLERRDDVPLDQAYDERIRLIARAEELDFWGYHLAEHHQEPLSTSPSQSVFLAAAARDTRTIRLGALVYLLPLYHPLRLIEEICMLDNLTSGRLQVGVGRGIAAIEHQFYGYDPEKAQARFTETLRVLVEGLRHDVLDHDGDLFRFERVPMEIRPKQEPYPPLWYAGNAVTAGTYGMNFLGGAPIERIPALVNAYRDAAASRTGFAATLNPHVEEPKIGTVRHIFVAPTDAEAEATARRAWAAYHSHYVRRGWSDNTGPVTSAAGAVQGNRGGPSMGGDFDLARRFEVCVAGSPSTLRDYVGRWQAESTANYFVGAFQWGDLDHAEAQRSLELFAEAAGFGG